MGGKAFDNTTPISGLHVNGIVKYVASELPLRAGYRVVGSSASVRGGFVGDIDIAVSSKHWTYDELKEALYRLTGVDNVSTHSESFNQIYTRVWTEYGIVQIDFMLGNTELLAFTHYSPNRQDSDYSGTHRTEYLKCIAKSLSETVEVDGEVIARVGYTLHHHKGLEYSARWRKMREDGTAYTKRMTPVNNLDEFRTLYPQLTVNEPFVEIKPANIVKKLFSESTTVSQVRTYEKCAELVNRLQHLRERSDLIWKLYTERLEEIERPIPERLA